MAAGEVDGRGDRIARQKEQRITSALNCRSGTARQKKKGGGRLYDDTEAVRHLLSVNKIMSGEIKKTK